MVPPRTAAALAATFSVLLCGIAGSGPAAASAAAPGLTPTALNDPLAGLQWHLRRDGLRTAWPKTLGAPVVVAVVDSGVDMTHRDLRQNLWRNRGERAGNGIDDDRNGYVDDVHGYDFVDRDGDPADEHGHGTHVAGILGARGGNGIGVSGVAPRARIMVVRALDANDAGNTDWLAASIDYAVANGARIVNVSVNTAADVPAVAAAIERARAAGVLLVVSAGNDGADLGMTPSYPACSSSPNVVTVAAVGRSGALSSFSNRGSCVDVTAPGEEIAATRRGGGYELRSGTSMAAPQVAGVAALALALHPRTGVDRLVRALTGASRPSRATASARTVRAPRISAARLLRRLAGG
jgi:subtilisin family serine protease